MNSSDFYKDPTVRRILQQLEVDGRLKIDMSIMDELQGYTVYAKKFEDISHATYRTLEDLHRLAATFEYVQFTRGRVIGIKVGHMPVLKILRRLWSAATTALYENFPELAKVSPVARKDHLLATVLARLREQLDNAEVLIEAATDVERLLGNAHFMMIELKQINEAFLEADKRERNI